MFSVRCTSQDRRDRRKAANCHHTSFYQLINFVSAFLEMHDSSGSRSSADATLSIRFQNSAVKWEFDCHFCACDAIRQLSLVCQISSLKPKFQKNETEAGTRTVQQLTTTPAKSKRKKIFELINVPFLTTTLEHYDRLFYSAASAFKTITTFRL